MSELERLLTDFETFLFTVMALQRPSRAVEHRKALRGIYKDKLLPLAEKEDAGGEADEDGKKDADTGMFGLAPVEGSRGLISMDMSAQPKIPLNFFDAPHMTTLVSGSYDHHAVQRQLSATEKEIRKNAVQQATTIVHARALPQPPPNRAAGLGKLFTRIGRRQLVTAQQRPPSAQKEADLLTGEDEAVLVQLRDLFGFSVTDMKLNDVFQDPFCREYAHDLMFKKDKKKKKKREKTNKRRDADDGFSDSDEDSDGSKSPHDDQERKPLLMPPLQGYPVMHDASRPPSMVEIPDVAEGGVLSLPPVEKLSTTPTSPVIGAKKQSDVAKKRSDAPCPSAEDGPGKDAAVPSGDASRAEILASRLLAIRPIYRGPIPRRVMQILRQLNSVDQDVNVYYDRVEEDSEDPAHLRGGLGSLLSRIQADVTSVSGTAERQRQISGSAASLGTPADGVPSTSDISRQLAAENAEPERLSRLQTSLDKLIDSTVQRQPIAKALLRFAFRKLRYPDEAEDLSPQTVRKDPISPTRSISKCLSVKNQRDELLPLTPTSTGLSPSPMARERSVGTQDRVTAQTSTSRTTWRGGPPPSLPTPSVESSATASATPHGDFIGAVAWSYSRGSAQSVASTADATPGLPRIGVRPPPTPGEADGADFRPGTAPTGPTSGRRHRFGQPVTNTSSLPPSHNSARPGTAPVPPPGSSPATDMPACGSVFAQSLSNGSPRKAGIRPSRPK
eukprot:TRINITY_DN17135_c0_g1_i1.p1 TRINITY_DN17135_c0_g1~~TRINITY_DN17135_c0_g1_i1.p1  ORF type:complete len:730 (-),score=141.72 TRINITY_DN17135_c0_g1_i1:148-2337(-)